MKFFFGADNEIKEMQRRLQFDGDRSGLDKAVLTIAMPGESPEVGAIIDIKHGTAIIFAGKLECLDDSRFGTRMR